MQPSWLIQFERENKIDTKEIHFGLADTESIVKKNIDLAKHYQINRIENFSSLNLSGRKSPRTNARQR